MESMDPTVMDGHEVVSRLRTLAAETGGENGKLLLMAADMMDVLLDRSEQLAKLQRV